MKRSFIKTQASFFALLCIVFIPFPFTITKLQLPVTDLIFGRSIGFIAINIFHTPLADTKVYSDSISMYILIALLFVLSVIIAAVVPLIKKWPAHSQKLLAILYQFFIYYLALQLLKYGADKIFKNQFYLPEPNTLFTPVGNMEKDILYWSAMGCSSSYNIFLGALEILSAVLILVKPTRLTGLLLSMGILINVVAINFGFDISVKLFSLLLLSLNTYLLFPFHKKLYQLLFSKTVDTPRQGNTVVFRKTFAIYFLQWLAIGLIACEVFYPFIRSRNLNGDNMPRPYLHGAYEVTGVITEKDTLAPYLSPVKRFFIHKDHYFILQDQQDKMKDYKLEYDTSRSVFMLTDYQLTQTNLSFTYKPTDSILTLQYFINGNTAKLIGKAINWRKLPALQKGFHWTVDGAR